jgi:hypothetical protein
MAVIAQTEAGGVISLLSVVAFRAGRAM